ncbi:fatty acid desaturase [Myxococcus stipitatus DSM 14675]|uniref:Fatty acid desaturase n=2 Tax=Myxococcus stipitatus TaxID=83455 RepID=L7U365_MYXSD|nr:fatty acid desaturase [Myxococcus stipitatus DSM 14675]
MLKETVVETMDVVQDAKDASVAKKRPEPQKWLLCPQRDADIKALCRPNGVKHLLFASPFILTYAAAMYGQFALDNVWANVALSVLLGHCLYTLFVLHHDCMHGTGFRNDFFNRLMGRLYATTFTMTFTVNRETHMRHHSHIADPERDPDEYYFAAELKDIWLRLWRYYQWYTTIALTRYGLRVRATVVTEQVINLAIWAAIHVVLIQMGLAMKLLYIFWLPLAVVVLIINPITRGYEHAPITLYPRGDSRRRDMSKNSITVANPMLGWLCANITYHVEHHSYPRCPFYNLQKLYKIFQEEKLQYLTAPYPLYRVWKGQKMLEGMTCNAD